MVNREKIRDIIIVVADIQLIKYSPLKYQRTFVAGGYYLTLERCFSIVHFLFHLLLVYTGKTIMIIRPETFFSTK